MDLKRPLSYKEQIIQLRNHGMTIADEEVAEQILRQINYYRFTGYALQFRKAPNDSDFIEKTTFEMVFDLVSFDEELRNLLRLYIEKVELFYRTVIAHEFAILKCTTPPYDQHYDENNFYNKTGYWEIRDHFQRERQYYQTSLVLKHHQKHYDDKMPLWAIVEMLSFSDLSKLYNTMYYAEKDCIANVVGVSKNTLANHLHCLSVLRNRCAHATRLYNTTFNPPARFTKDFLKKHPDVSSSSLFAYCLVLVKRLPNQQLQSELSMKIKTLLEKNKGRISLSLIGFPKDYELILMNNQYRDNNENNE